MAGKFQWEKFSNLNLNDTFFDSLKKDYPEFVDWFNRKSINGEETLVFKDDYGIGAFLYLKDEEEPLELNNQILPSIKRVKIGTLRLSERQRGIRLGEGALGVALWKWQEKQVDEIYVTVFDSHVTLIRLFERFGFTCVGLNNRGERVYIKSRKNLDYSDSYKSFPFISSNFTVAGIIPIYEDYHDKLFPYSELKGNSKEVEEEVAGNGITKIFIATPSSLMHYNVGEPVGIYRISQIPPKTYKSVITSYATITKVITVKSNNYCYYPLDSYIDLSGNKTIYSQKELTDIYMQNKTVVVLEMVYNGYFGKGHNITHNELQSNGLFETYPYNIEYTKNEFIRILEMGDTNVQNVIID
ncbi:hypothetical protein QA584_17510 [Anaerocolumna sp. AGMB13025]|uniref:GNAT family N-acetyltransferase n=1 Tax=Anaerocolumna sp. AGMB13025 TaxID=3039116 RepID=UPI00241E8C7B|nr:hypothetical protein [Anaerocolumna sp. AGMB13025]WFR55399.1 hypothetical protein QA584_17510 [Anaerocolumna sp. AGMB13025]